MKTKEIKRFQFRHEAAKHARDVNAMLESIGEALDKFAFTKHDKSSNASGDWVVEMTYNQEPPKAAPKAAPIEAKQSVARKSGSNRGQRRLWLEGKALQENGFTVGTMLQIVKKPDCVLLTVSNDESVKRIKIAGTQTRPILDLNGKWVSEMMGNHTHFRADILQNQSIDIYPITPKA